MVYHRFEELIGVYRFFHKAVYIGVDGPDKVFLVVKGSGEDYLCIMSYFLNMSDHLNAVHVRHVYIGNDHIGRVCLEHLKPFPAITGGE
ncbi:MAG: hypothetical protein HQL61_17055 [Magnetococcales bacterium]|nr:hypothetical protein [Nitrospirota bacterium]